MNDKLYSVYCIVGGKIWDYFAKDEIVIGRGYAYTRISVKETTNRLNEIIKKYGLML